MINFVTGVDGEQRIAIKRQKTDIPSCIPSLPGASILLRLYEKNQPASIPESCIDQ